LVSPCRGGDPIGLIDKFLGARVTVPLIEYLRDPIVLLSRDGRLKAANAPFRDLVSQKIEKLIDRDCRDCAPLNELWNPITAALLHGNDLVERLTFAGRVYDVTITPAVDEVEGGMLIVLFRDVSQFVRIENELTQKTRELIVTNTLSSTFIKSSEPEAAFAEILEKILLVTDMKIGWIAMGEGEQLKIRSERGVSKAFREKIAMGELDFLVKSAMEGKDPLTVLERKDTEAISALNGEGIVFIAIMPIRFNDKSVGVLAVAHRAEVAFEIEQASLFSLISNNVSLIVEKLVILEELESLATTDSLTGLYNTRYFYKILESEVTRTERYGLPFSLILFDIDNFKAINDNFGHQAGDAALQIVARALTDSSRRTDTVARYGGEEFIVLMPNTPKSEAEHLALRLKEAVEKAEYPGLGRAPITLSGGVAACPRDASTATELLNAADMAMYRAKRTGKNKVVLYEPEKVEGGAQ
jgi:diguanylate cyclase (GGDEF)-like protein